MCKPPSPGCTGCREVPVSFLNLMREHHPHRRAAVLAALALAPTLAEAAVLAHLGRRAALLAATAALHGAPPAVAATWENPFKPPDRTGLKSRPLEQLRILLQDEADAIQYGGSEGLAPGGAPPATGILLIPILQMRQRLAALGPVLTRYDGATWTEMRLELSSGNFETVAFKKIFNAFSDNIYYGSETPEANAYLLGGATPSTSQTMQYLQRNEALKQLTDLRDELGYQGGLPAEQRDVEYAQELLASTVKAFDAYFKLAPAEQLSFARKALNLEE
jgi:hypothetical protein